MLEINTQKPHTLLPHVDEKIITVYFHPSLVFIKTIVTPLNTGYSPVILHFPRRMYHTGKFITFVTIESYTHLTA